MVFNKTKPKPNWLIRHYDAPGAQRSQRRANQLWQAQPLWANRKAMRAVYREMKQRRKRGECVEVDHILPINHPYFCGLHVETNLRIVPADRNRWDSNTRHADHPQRDLFECSHADDYFELECT